jgi:hypothetical protein
MSTTRTRTVKAVAAAGFALAAVAGCTGQPTPTPSAGASTSSYPTPNPSISAQPLPTTSPSPYPVALPDAGDVNRRDATATAQAAVVTMWSTDMATDPSQYQAQLRAAWLLAPAYLASITAHPPIAAPGAWWSACAAHHAYTSVSASVDHDTAPPDTATSAYRQFSIVVTPHGDSGWTGPTQAETVFVVLTRPEAGQPWAVAGVETSD